MTVERVKVGAAQVAPKFLDKAGTITKIGDTLAEASALGLDLIVFPETFLSAYPYWRGAVSVRRETELTVAMQRSAVRIPSEDTDALCELARRANVNCVIGVNELDDRPGSLTMFNSLIVISRDGQLLGRHRKLMPTHLRARLLGHGRRARHPDIRHEHRPRRRPDLLRAPHDAVARGEWRSGARSCTSSVWPGWWNMDTHLGAKRPEAGSRGCDVEPAVRSHAIENSTFVVSSSWYLPAARVPPELAPLMTYNLAVGGSCIVNPSGLFVREPVFEKETIVWAEIDQTERRLAKAYFDSVGHYSRWDLLQLAIREEGWEPVVAPDPSSARLREAADRYEIRLERLESLVETLIRKLADRA